MKISVVAPNNAISSYNEKKKISNNKINTISRDSVEISNVGKSLSSYSIDNFTLNSNEKIDAIKSAVSNGTYSSNAVLTARKILDIIKNKGV